ncbi:hypothetical protein SLG_00090 [Sphingobium sp. SYK-6]|uniref:DUF1491 family protein n=1 Tax=Sphingobium sp. (strain NBRC 103272 / SYK-6) TaxID=627192 RepID=UPI00022768EE|nr:DUF1491 family protein [Sphingobium sp. SYK-6]BAK64684.1 hypothetical protein SLG_00090 [Sphingobium sp. SYK-6]
MSSRPTTQFLVGALVRAVEAQGGMAAVLHKGEPESGSIVVQLVEKGRNHGFYERVTALSGAVELTPCGPRNMDQPFEMMEYIERRVRSDPDIWFVELDVADGEQLAAAILCAA